MSVIDLNRARGGNNEPPNDLRAEAALLGAMFLNQDAVAVACERLQPGDFYKPAHGHIFEAITSLAGAGEPINATTVASELDRAGLSASIGGAGYLVSLIADCPSTTSSARYAQDILDCAHLRRLIGAGGELVEMGRDGRADVPSTLDRAEALVFEVTQQRCTENSVSHMTELLDGSLDRLEQLYEQGEEITGLRTGFNDLDQLLSGLQPGALHIVGGRPAMGKTSIALNTAMHVVCEEKAPTLLFSLEMSRMELAMRLLCAEARVDSRRVRNGRLNEADWKRVADATGRLSNVPLWIDDNPNLTIMELRAKARRLKSKVGELGLIIVDYLQLMTGRHNAESRQVEVSEISRGLKILARELEVPVIALSQLSRTLESRTDKRPMLSDLRETGALEQDADVVLFCYRDELYNPDSPDRGTAEIIVAKHRAGPVGQIRLAYLAEYTRFANLARGV